MVPINYLAVLLAAVAAMVLGFLWYGPLFGKKWQSIMGFTPESMSSMKMTPLQATIGGFIGAILMAYVLAHGLVFGNAYLGMSGLSAGLQGAFWYWLGFVVPITAGVVLWEGKPWVLWALNAGYYLVSFAVMASILTLWP